MKIEIDKEADSAYIYFKAIAEGEATKTISLNENIIIDLDSSGKILGMEILNASKVMPKQVLTN
jgi:uncharacterized protein YuzE